MFSVPLFSRLQSCSQFLGVPASQSLLISLCLFPIFHFYLDTMQICYFWWFGPAKYFSVYGIPCPLVWLKIFKNDFCLFLFVNLVSLFIGSFWKTEKSMFLLLLPYCPSLQIFFFYFLNDTIPSAQILGPESGIRIYFRSADPRSSTNKAAQQRWGFLYLSFQHVTQHKDKLSFICRIFLMFQCHSQSEKGTGRESIHKLKMHLYIYL